VEERVEDTCQWFLQHEQIETGVRPLLVTADPGCGKSVLAKYLIDHACYDRESSATSSSKTQDQITIRQALCALSGARKIVAIAGAGIILHQYP
jgi:hypothetical protein